MKKFNMKKFNKYTTGIIVLFILIFIGCTNLNEKVYDKLPIDEYGTTTKQINSLIAPIYSTLKNTFAGDLWALLECTSDMSITPTKKGGDWWDGGQYKRMREQTWTPSDAAITNGYNNCMNAISTCNQIYYTIENSTANIENKDQFLADIRGVRAFWYYMLIDNWGNVPIVTDFTDTSKPVTNSRKEVYEFVLSELNAIKDSVRSDVTSDSYGKITKGVVFTLLAKMYLNAEVWNPDGGAKWQECADACDSVMSLSYVLEPEWKVNFQVHNETSREIIFPAIFSISDGSYIAGRTLHYLDPIALGLNIGADNGICSMPAYVKSFDPKDKRKGWSFLLGAMINPATGDTLITAHGRPLIHTEDVTMKYNIDADGWGYVEQEDGARCFKWEFDKGISGGVENDFAIFRLADVYLMKAEALVRMNKENDEATILVNKIRSRAFDDASELKSTVTLDDIYQERRFEFAWEGMGRQDQIRFGTFRNAIPGWKLETDVNHELFPIPQTAINVNPSLQQNPGY